MAKVVVTDTHLTDIANAIREKNGETTAYKPSEMANAISNIETGGDTSIEDSFITKTLSGTYTNDRVTLLGKGALFGSQITSASFPNVTKVAERGFAQCTLLEEVSLPKVTTFETYTFYESPKLKRVYAPLLSSTGSTVFRGCTAIEEIELPSLTSTSTYFCYGCTNLKRADLGNLRSISSNFFTNCSSLETVILRKEDAICTLANTSVFSGTPIANGTGFVYVTDNLLEKYTADSKWITTGVQIKPLSELVE